MILDNNEEITILISETIEDIALVNAVKEGRKMTLCAKKGF